MRIIGLLMICSCYTSRSPFISHAHSRYDSNRMMQWRCSHREYRLDMRNHLIIFVVFLSLLVTVHLTLWYYISATLSTSSTRNVIESVVVIDVDGDFTDRIARFNVELHRLRQQLLLTSPENAINKTSCRISATDNRTSVSYTHLTLPTKRIV